MATTVKIGGDTTGLDAALSKAQVSVGKATAGMGKGLATALGSSLGPFGEIIEKADAFKASLDGASFRTKVFAGAIGIAMAASAYAVYKVKESWDDMRQAIDDAAESRKRFDSESKDVGATISSGIIAGQEARAMALSLEKLRTLQDQITAGVDEFNVAADAVVARPMTDEESRPILDEINKVIRNIADIQSGATTVRGESRGFASLLSKESSKAIDDERLRRQASGLTPSDIQALKQQRTDLVNIRQDQDKTRAGAITANVATESIDRIDRLLKLVEAGSATGRQGTVRFAELASIGGASSLPGVQARQDATKEVVKGVQKTNSLLADIKTEISNGALIK